MTFVQATQSWDDLENEHKLFQNLLRLLRMVRADNPEEELRASLSVFDEVLRCASKWIRQYKHESSMRRLSNLEPSAWIWTDEQQATLGLRLDDARRGLSDGLPIPRIGEICCLWGSNRKRKSSNLRSA